MNFKSCGTGTFEPTTISPTPRKRLNFEHVIPETGQIQTQIWTKPIETWTIQAKPEPKPFKIPKSEPINLVRPNPILSWLALC